MTYVIDAQNVAEALPRGVEYLLSSGVSESTRAGTCLVAPGPVVTCLRRPTERVVFSALRDANPFFHIVEALWMLAGRNDSATLDRYVSDFGSRFAETGGVVHGAYGHRWRMALGIDQLDVIVRRLRADPSTRQCVLQMWDCQISDDLLRDWKDRPCNTHVYFRVTAGCLDVTVCNRSHDVVWGLFGANAVHFSVLQEYVAARVGLSIGHLTFFSNNFHVYESMLDVLRSRADGCTNVVMLDLLRDDRYFHDVNPEPMFTAPDSIDDDVAEFFKRHDDPRRLPQCRYENRWFFHTAERAVLVHDLCRRGDYRRALTLTSTISPPDWAVACSEWVQRREARSAKSA
jgi:thymidylate synthase